jgi:hypothetical protein
MMRVKIAADQAGFSLKGQRAESLRGSGYDDVDLGAHHLNSGAHSPDFNIPLPVALAPGQVRIAAESLIRLSEISWLNPKSFCTSTFSRKDSSGGLVDGTTF